MFLSIQAAGSQFQLRSNGESERGSREAAESRFYSTMPICRVGLKYCAIEKKGTRKIRVCVYFKNLNWATPKDEYPMPVTDVLLNNASGHKLISFLDGNAG
jgi:hypothetical protein